MNRWKKLLLWALAPMAAYARNGHVCRKGILGYGCGGNH